MGQATGGHIGPPASGHDLISYSVWNKMSKQTNDFQQLIAMVVELLEDGMIVEESKEFPDPDTGVMREVDVYALIQGKANGRQITIAVECVDRKRRGMRPGSR